MAEGRDPSDSERTAAGSVTPFRLSSHSQGVVADPVTANCSGATELRARTRTVSAARPARLGKPTVACYEWTVEHLGRRDVRGVVGGEVAPQLPDPVNQLRDLNLVDHKGRKPIDRLMRGPVRACLRGPYRG
jgi:hypothetical protein